MTWLPRSPDLKYLNFFLWGHMKQMMDGNVVETEEDLAVRITVAADTIADMPGMQWRTVLCLDGCLQNRKNEPIEIFINIANFKGKIKTLNKHLHTKLISMK